MWLKRLKNNKKKNCMFLNSGFEALYWGDKKIKLMCNRERHWD